MSDRARINIIGRLTQKPEIRTNSNGKQFATFSVATNYYDTVSRQQATMYMSCIAGERHVKYMQGAEAGDKIDVIGRLTPNVYTDKQGVQHESFSILVDDVDVTKKSTGTAPAASQQRPQAPAGQQQYQQNRYKAQHAPAPQQQNGYYEQNPFESQGQCQGNGFRPATYNY